jgi:hypothetical protein
MRPAKPPSGGFGVCSAGGLLPFDAALVIDGCAHFELAIRFDASTYIPKRWQKAAKRLLIVDVTTSSFINAALDR